MKRVMILCGSPRDKGNTMTVVRWAAEGARASGAEVEIVVANQLNYKVNGCIACMSCQNSEEFGCVINDDASPIIARIPKQDVLVFATPVYFMGFSAQLKLIIDRMFSLFKIHEDWIDYAPLIQKTSLVLIATAAGREDEGMKFAVETMEAIAFFISSPLKKFLVPSVSLGPSDLHKNEELKAKAIDLGRSLVD